MTKILAPGAACVIPEQISGLPVTELADRLFSGSRTEEIFLPATLKRIGRYAFYNCEKLERLEFYGGVREIGGGLFNGCGRVRELLVRLEGDERSGLRDFVTELSGRLTARIFFPGPDGGWREEARLIFPAYYDEAVENTPARIISSSIHGSGQRYRYCFEDRKIRYDRYDQQFFYERNEESVSMAAEVALFRLMFPRGLSEGAGRAYEEFLKEHLFEVFLENLGNMEVFLWLLQEFCPETGAKLSEEALDRLIEEAAGRRQTGVLSYLMEEKRREFGVRKRSFDL